MFKEFVCSESNKLGIEITNKEVDLSITEEKEDEMGKTEAVDVLVNALVSFAKDLIGESLKHYNEQKESDPPDECVSKILVPLHVYKGKKKTFFFLIFLIFFYFFNLFFCFYFFFFFNQLFVTLLVLISCLTEA